jgi:hypothetical protein
VKREDAEPWVAAAALAAGAAAVRAAIWLLPASGSDVERARALGIVSVSILAGHSKSDESLAYAVGLGVALAVSLGIWAAWARPRPPWAAPAPRPRLGATELLAVTALFALLFARPWAARAVWVNPWMSLAEEGEALAWIDTVLRGGVLSRDTFCLYGPLSTWSAALLFRAAGPSLGLWQAWIFALDAAALVGTYWLARALLLTRWGALAATLLVALLCVPAYPAMSWCLMRVGLGLVAVAALTRGRTAVTGALLAATLAYSQEVGIACAAGVASALLATRESWRAWAWTGAGALAVLVPIALQLAAQGALGATFDNLFLFPRTRLLGFGALPFPSLELSSDSLRAWSVPAWLAVTGFATGTRLLRGARDARTRSEVALFVFSALLFTGGLSRPDDTHFAFAAPPVLLLLTGLLEDAALALRSATTRLAGAAGLLAGVAALAPWAGIALFNVLTFVTPEPGGFRALDLPRGGGARMPARFAQDIEAITREVQARVARDEAFWVFPNEALLYFLADRPQPTRYPLGLFAVTREQRRQLVSELERSRPRYAVVYLYAPRVDNIPYELALPELMAYLTTRYEFEDNFGSFALWRRKN